MNQVAYDEEGRARQERQSSVNESGEMQGLVRAALELMSCQTQAELAGSAAALARQLVGCEEVRVILRTPEGESTAATARGNGELARWAEELLGAGTRASIESDEQRLAVAIRDDAAHIHGIIALGAVHAVGDAQRRALAGLAQFVTLCSSRLLERSRALRALGDVQRIFGKGLHDLRTPLNSLRLGLHLLEPGMSTHDPSVVQRANRAVDRMAALVSEMFEALQALPTTSGPERPNASASVASHLA